MERAMPLRFPISNPAPPLSAELAPHLLTFIALGNFSNHRGWKGGGILPWDNFFSMLRVLFRRKLYCASNQPEILSLASLCGKKNLMTHQVCDSSVSTIGVWFLFGLVFFYDFQIIPAPAPFVKYVISAEKGWELRRLQKRSGERIYFSFPKN